jgi:hypothetical protein
MFFSLELQIVNSFTNTFGFTYKTFCTAREVLTLYLLPMTYNLREA